MTISKYFKMSFLLALAGIAGCTKLNETYKSTIPADQAAAALGSISPALLLQQAYNDIPGPFVGQVQCFFPGRKFNG